MPLSGENSRTEDLSGSSAQPSEPRRPSVGRLRIGESLQPIRRTTQDLCLFRDDVGGRSALVSDRDVGDKYENEARHGRDGSARSSPRSRCRGGNSPQSCDDHPVKSPQRRLSPATSTGKELQRHPRRRYVQKNLGTELICVRCGEISSPEWRSGPAGPGTLCNVCGLIYAKQESHKKGKSKSRMRKKQ